MKEINVFIEINGKKNLAGVITYNNSEDAFFTYDEEYAKKNKSISISLPTTKKSFSPSESKFFFDGLLPEGYVRNAIAESMHFDVNDYISLLLLLGKECIGLDDFKTLPFGSKMINDSIDNIVSNFPIALKKACNDLVEDGYTEIEKIYKMIMQLLDNKISKKE